MSKLEDYYLKERVCYISFKKCDYFPFSQECINCLKELEFVREGVIDYDTRYTYEKLQSFYSDIEMEIE